MELSLGLTSDGFEKLLTALSENRDAAGEHYELMRLKLVKFFELRMCTTPDDLADETIDRVARRLAEGEHIEAPEAMRFVYGVARNVLLEWWKTQRRQSVARFPAPVTGSDDSEEDREVASERQMECFRQSMKELPDDARGLLVRYYEHSGRTKIDDRLVMTQELGIPLNALRIRIHRIKAYLQRQIEKCIRGFAT
jgi:DNA-directed RNA polymerase specialized sigma24 family protein